MVRRTALKSFQQEDKPQDPSGYESHDHESQEDQTATCRQRRYVEQHRINHGSFARPRAEILQSALR